MNAVGLDEEALVRTVVLRCSGAGVNSGDLDGCLRSVELALIRPIGRWPDDVASSFESSSLKSLEYLWGSSVRVNVDIPQSCVDVEESSKEED
ncbi:hypothetical protein V5O48_003600 [Marasmius crinis-equi]|uniref:Uncharacterized protein n=1 Tax=Marasmius crinis-equi TaxID=585013 RepID=A0ABR3FSE5_9AGAR